MKNGHFGSSSQCESQVFNHFHPIFNCPFPRLAMPARTYFKQAMVTHTNTLYWGRSLIHLPQYCQLWLRMALQDSRPEFFLNSICRCGYGSNLDLFPCNTWWDHAVLSCAGLGRLTCLHWIHCRYLDCCTIMGKYMHNYGELQWYLGLWG